MRLLQSFLLCAELSHTSCLYKAFNFVCAGEPPRAIATDVPRIIIRSTVHSRRSPAIVSIVPALHGNVQHQDQPKNALALDAGGSVNDAVLSWDERRIIQGAQAPSPKQCHVVVRQRSGAIGKIVRSPPKGQAGKQGRDPFGARSPVGGDQSHRDRVLVPESTSIVSHDL